MATKKMGMSLPAINAQIAALQAKAEEIRKKEVGEVIARIKDAIAHYGLTAADLGFKTGVRVSKAQGPMKSARKAERKAGNGAAKTKPASVAKYSDGQGRTWSGIGKRPGWFKDALAAGKSPADLLIKS
jgi:DNA-binding protein H-NS